jgi:hypothetical protein
MRFPSANAVLAVFQPRCTFTLSLRVPFSRSILLLFSRLIKIDHLLKFHTTATARKELEAALWQFLQTLRASDALRSVNTIPQQLEDVHLS